MFSSAFLACSLLLFGVAQAHLYIVSPAPYTAKENPNAKQPNFDIASPINAAQWPCSGASGPSVATLKAGEQATVQFSGGAAHGGGSCQVGLSYDSQKTFYVMHSFIGDCPTAGGSVSYTVPADAPAGDATLAWVWHNKIGNREVYANCAGVTVEAGSGATPSVAFNDRPDLFVANLDNGCRVPDGDVVVYPNPGPDVTGDASGAPLTGCQPINGIGNTRTGGSGGGSPQPPVSPPSQSATSPSPSQAPTPTTAPSNGPVIGVPPKIPSSSVLETPAPTPSSTAPTTPDVKALSPDGTCGEKYKCAPGFCCSSSGFCGNSELHCRGTSPAQKRAVRAGHGRFHFKHT